MFDKAVRIINVQARHNEAFDMKKAVEALEDLAKTKHRVAKDVVLCASLRP